MAGIQPAAGDEYQEDFGMTGKRAAVKSGKTGSYNNPFLGGIFVVCCNICKACSFRAENHRNQHDLLLDESDNGCARVAARLNFVLSRSVRQTFLLPVPARFISLGYHGYIISGKCE